MLSPACLASTTTTWVPDAWCLPLLLMYKTDARIIELFPQVVKLVLRRPVYDFLGRGYYRVFVADAHNNGERPATSLQSTSLLFGTQLCMYVTCCS
jgi:hypothetical protein